MKNLTVKFSTRLYLAKRKQKAGNRYAVVECLQEFKHYLRQQHKDYNKRGKTNREGSDNRSARKHANKRIIYENCLFSISA